MSGKRPWKDLKILQKLALLVLLAMVLVVAPEFMVFVDLGGAEFAASLLLINLTSIKHRFLQMVRRVRQELALTFSVIQRTPLGRRQVLLTNGALSLCAMVLTSSLLYSTVVFFAPLALATTT